MDIDNLTSLALRLFFVGAFLVLVLAVIEKGLNLIGQGVPGVYPAQLLQWSVVLLIFVIAILLRQIRNQRKCDWTTRVQVLASGYLAKRSPEHPLAAGTGRAPDRCPKKRSCACVYQKVHCCVAKT